MSGQGKSWMKNKGVPGNKPQQQQPHFRATRDPSRDLAVRTEPLPETHSGKTPSVQGVMGLAQFGKGWRFGSVSGVPVLALQHCRTTQTPLAQGSASPRWDPAGIKEQRGTEGSVLGLCWVLGDPGEVTVPCSSTSLVPWLCRSLPSHGMLLLESPQGHSQSPGFCCWSRAEHFIPGAKSGMRKQK